MWMFISIIIALATAILCLGVDKSILCQKFKATGLACNELGSTLPAAIIAPGAVMGSVGCVGHQYEIIKPIIGSIIVNMVNNLIGSQRPPNMIGHDKAMFCDIPDVTLLEGIWVIGAKKIHITVGSYKTPTLPAGISQTFCSVTRKIATVLSFANPVERGRTWLKRSAASAFTFHGNSPFSRIVSRSRRWSQGV